MEQPTDMFLLFLRALNRLAIDKAMINEWCERLGLAAEWAQAQKQTA